MDTFTRNLITNKN